MSATIIAFEGLDCSFKETNAKSLKESLEKLGYKVHLTAFPAYDQPSSYFVKKFLSGEYGKDLDFRTILYFYALDRFDRWNLTDLRSVYENGDSNTIIIFDRWTKSNLYQCARFPKPTTFSTEEIKNQIQEHKKEIDDIIDYEVNLENNILKLPVEDICIFLHSPYEVSRKFRENKPDADINEKDELFMFSVYNTFDYIMQERFPDTIILDTTYRFDDSDEYTIKDRDSLAHDVLIAVLNKLNELNKGVISNV